MKRLRWAAFGLVVSACFQLPEGALYRCEPDDTCPQSAAFFCGPDGLCHPREADAGEVDAGPFDGGSSDGGPGDAGLGCGPSTKGECPALLTCGARAPGQCDYDTAFCTEDGWCWEWPKPQGNTLRAIAAYDGGFWAVGDHGTIVRFDGQKLYRVRSPVDVHLNGLWLDGPDDVWVVGDTAVRLHLAAGQWAVQTSPLGPKNLRAILRQADGGLVTVGGNCFIATSNDGVSWTDEVPSSCSCDLSSVQEMNGQLVSAGGTQVAPGTSTGCVVFGSGAMANVVTTATGALQDELRSIAVHQGELYFGSRAGVFQLDGGQFVTQSTLGLVALRESPDGTLWGAGVGGLVSRLEPGGVWSNGTPDGGVTSLSLAFEPSGRGTAVGVTGAMLTLDSSTRQLTSSWQGSTTNFSWGDVWVSAQGAVYAVGSEDNAQGKGFRAYRGPVASNWSVADSLRGRPEDVWAPGTGLLDFASVGTGRLTAPGENVSLLPVGSPALKAIWGFSPTDVCVAGSGLALNGSLASPVDTWRALSMPVDATLNELHGFGASVFGAGQQNTDGGGVVLKLSQGGDSFTLELASGGPAFSGVWARSDSVYVVGAQGTVFIGDAGTRANVPLTWLALDAGVQTHLNAVWAEGQVFIAGDQGVVLREVNGGFVLEQTGTGAKLRGVGGLADGGGVWVVGDDQVILRRRP